VGPPEATFHGIGPPWRVNGFFRLFHDNSIWKQSVLLNKILLVPMGVLTHGSAQNITINCLQLERKLKLKIVKCKL
jgi:hypothetical protein